MTDAPMQHARHFVNKVLEVMLITIMAVLVLDVLWQVFTRFVLENPSSYTEELARYLMIWVGLLGAGYAAGKKMHLAVDLLPRKLTGRKATILSIVIQVCTLLFALTVMVGGGARLVWTMLYLGQTSAGLQIPLGYVYLVVPISGSLIAFYAVCDLLTTRRQTWE